MKSRWCGWGASTCQLALQCGNNHRGRGHATRQQTPPAWAPSKLHETQNHCPLQLSRSGSCIALDQLIQNRQQGGLKPSCLRVGPRNRTTHQIAVGVLNAALGSFGACAEVYTRGPHHGASGVSASGHQHVAVGTVEACGGSRDGKRARNDGARIAALRPRPTHVGRVPGAHGSL